MNPSPSSAVYAAKRVFSLLVILSALDGCFSIIRGKKKSAGWRFEDYSFCESFENIRRWWNADKNSRKIKYECFRYVCVVRCRRRVNSQVSSKSGWHRKISSKRCVICLTSKNETRETWKRVFFCFFAIHQRMHENEGITHELFSQKWKYFIEI